MNTQSISSLFAGSDITAFTTSSDTELLCLAFPFYVLQLKKEDKTIHQQSLNFYLPILISALDDIFQAAKSKLIS